MKIMHIALILAISLVIFGCAAEQKVVVAPQKQPAPEVKEEPMPAAEEVKEPPKAKTCEEKAKLLFPQQISLTLAANHDPNSAGWDMVEGTKWSDGTAMDYKGDIEFQKGRNAGENANYWYTRNIQNEKLFGIGGLKYSKQKTIGKTEFIMKVVLEPIRINKPADEFTPHTGTFKIVESTFSECLWTD